MLVRTIVGPRGIRLRAEVPRTRRERRTGLLGRRSLGPDEAMLFEDARSVHTIGIAIEIAAVLLGSDLQVREVVRLRPHRILAPRPGSASDRACGASSSPRLVLLARLR